MLSNPLISFTGQDPLVRFEKLIEHTLWRSLLPPWLARSCWISERQKFAWVESKASNPVLLLDCPIRIVIIAWSWGQQITLAKKGAKEAKQSTAVVLIKLSTAVKFNEHCPKQEANNGQFTCQQGSFFFRVYTPAFVQIAWIARRSWYLCACLCRRYLCTTSFACTPPSKGQMQIIMVSRGKYAHSSCKISHIFRCYLC